MPPGWESIPGLLKMAGKECPTASKLIKNMRNKFIVNKLQFLYIAYFMVIMHYAA
jgi:hypothetical protein